MPNLSDISGIFGELMNDSEYKAYGCELCPAWLHAKCVFPNTSDTKLRILFEFNSSFDVKCQERQQQQKAKLANLVTKDNFNNFTQLLSKKLNLESIIVKNVMRKLMLKLQTQLKTIWLTHHLFNNLQRNKKIKYGSYKQA